MTDFREWMKVQDAFERAILEDFRGELQRAADMHTRADYLNRLQLFQPDRLPDNAYQMWSNVTDKGRRMRPDARKVGEAPKITFNRFIQRKRDEMAKLRREFQAMYGFDFSNIDLDRSTSQHVYDRRGNLIAPISH